MVSAANPVAPAPVALVSARARRVATPLGDGGQIVWHVWGEGNAAAAPLVLLHGGSGSWTHWLRNIDALVAAGREVWAVDLPGFGDSDGVPGGQDADTMPAPLHQSLQQLLGQRPFDLVGFSFGGMTAGMLAAAHPQGVRQLVVVGAPAMWVSGEKSVRLLGWRHLDSETAREQAHRHNLQALMLHDPARIDADTVALHVQNVLRDRLPRRRLSQTDVLAQALGRVVCPVQAIYGRHDALYRGRHAALEQAFVAASPYFEGLHWVDGAGHWVQYEQPERFNAQLLACLAAGSR
ncbi:alpha/beta fold hydrolase [Comamonas antarctica]|uniref:Alpha/beta fold hydrolase n=1 Tax=Comamonas antarctica TaxID=2743470 RepID=A0A6N1WZG5_9BURK|nr:alpha/beta fold hydrolase [Comamonas antarctica]QKV52549.1 alpha/beta fold hydrolase [Comamonas antarctica]